MKAKPAGAEKHDARPAAAEKPAQPPAPKPAEKKPAPAPEKKPALPVATAPKANRPAPVFVPLARAGQQAASNKHVMTAKEALAAKAKAVQGAKPAAPAPAKPAEAAPPAAPAVTFDDATLSVGWEGAKAAIDAAGANATALVDAWLAGSNAAALAAISESDHVSGPARKAARRAVAMLRARGIAIPSRTKVANLAEEKVETLEATMIPPDSFGTWSIAITARDNSGRFRIAEVIGREPAGVVQAAGGWLSGSQLKEGRARALNNVGMSPVAVPLDWAKSRIASTLKLNATSGQVVPLGLESCRELIQPAPAEAPQHPVADLEAKVTADMVADRAKISAELHNEPEFAGWIPDRRSLDALLQQVGQRLGPAGVRDGAAVNVAIDEESAAATDRYFTPEVRADLATRMRDSAISLRVRKGDDRALDALAVAQAVREAGLITSPPREVPFLAAFFQKGVSLLARMGGGQIRIPVPQAAPAPAAEAPAADETSTPDAAT